MWNSVLYEFSDPRPSHIPPFHFPALYNQAVYESDEFRMYEFKIKRCPRLRSHDWIQCPFAHRGEKAARRDPRRFSYHAAPCPEFKQTGMCRRGDMCHFSHGVFEQWLHPERYRTRMCSAGDGCQRPVCFFAHSREELRVHEPRFICHCMPQSRPNPTVVTGNRLLAGGSSRGGATTSTAPGPPPPPQAPVTTITAFTGGTDFLASLSGLRVREGEDKPRSIFGWYAPEPGIPNINWVEEEEVVD